MPHVFLGLGPSSSAYSLPYELKDLIISSDLVNEKQLGTTSCLPNALFTCFNCHAIVNRWFLLQSAKAVLPIKGVLENNTIKLLEQLFLENLQCILFLTCLKAHKPRLYW